MEQPKLLIIAGPNGSGKTSVTGKILKHDWVKGCKYINPDLIAQEKFGDWNSHKAIIDAANFAAEEREKSIENRESLIFETVLSAQDKIDFIKKAKENDFFIRLFFIGTENPQINAFRVARRVMEGGHDVPIAKIISRYYKSIANCAYVAKLVDRLYVYDNSVEDAFPQLLFRASDGKLIKEYSNINDWAKEIFEKISEIEHRT